MTQIRAFVGHSFVAEDEAVIRTFLDYFDQMKGALPDFDWVHAKAAQPTELAAKVLKLVEGQNVFIGICTRRERVAATQKFRQSWIDGSKLIASEADLEWKTSDWIIQEIGLAIGRNMTIVLLVENDCRKPGGLQGDVEFISFDRAAPERAFGQLLEMMMALSPRRGAGETASTDTATDAADEIEPAAQEKETPDDTWDYDRFENAFVWKVISGDEEEAASIEAAYLATNDATHPEKRAEWNALCDSWRILFGRGGNLERLKQLRLEHPENPKIIRNLGNAMASLGNHSGAAKEFEAAAENLEADRIEAERLRGKAAVQLAKDGQTQLALVMLNRQRQRIAEHPDEELNLLHAMKEIAEITKDTLLELHIMERITEMRPDDWSNRFNLAYKYSNNDYNDLALFHYTQIPSLQRTAMTWNNLGVEYQQFSMPGKSIDAYRRSSSAGETLAMSNLAYKFMEAGFVEEARTELEAAFSKKEYHRNVGQAMTTLQDIAEKEQKKLEKTLEELKPKMQFFKNLGLAVAAPDAALESTIWQGPDCPLTVEITEGAFVASGNYAKKQSGLGLAVSGQETVHQYEVRYTGKVFGRRIVGTVERRRLGGSTPSSLLSLASGDDAIETMMIISADRGRISVVEKPSSTSPRYYEMAKGKKADIEIQSPAGK